MALQINGVTGTFDVPRVVGSYLFTSYERTMKFRVIVSEKVSQEKTVNVQSKFEAVWRLVEEKAKRKPCNEYFAKLARKKTLKEVLDEADIILHLLQPKPKFGPEVLPLANAAGRDIGLNPAFLNEEDNQAIACTLVHELAHIAGATTNPNAKDAHAAELALTSCKCTSFYDKDIVGINNGFQIKPSATSRVA